MDHFAQTLRVLLEQGVTKEPPYEKSCLFEFHVKPNQCVSGMDKIATKEISVACEERRLFQPEEQRDYVVIPNSGIAKVTGN